MCNPSRKIPISPNKSLLKSHPDVLQISVARSSISIPSFPARSCISKNCRQVKHRKLEPRHASLATPADRPRDQLRGLVTALRVMPLERYRTLILKSSNVLCSATQLQILSKRRIALLVTPFLCGSGEPNRQCCSLQFQPVKCSKLNNNNNMAIFLKSPRNTPGCMVRCYNA